MTAFEFFVLQVIIYCCYILRVLGVLLVFMGAIVNDIAILGKGALLFIFAKIVLYSLSEKEDEI